ncbi:hypothetical protein B0A48_04965 [Cryoendolithus antarcticus]|uniref:Ubiquitin-like protease family profile domain-containing protein n=1 Tax=Cryoendolithus antarcticus TaxID=1507870 RepID=A0A1V8TDW0_9PEZI|nr:hypothetical protein B0A48_04965 [Cryoendolithus antarcticus]
MNGTRGAHYKRTADFTDIEGASSRGETKVSISERLWPASLLSLVKGLAGYALDATQSTHEAAGSHIIHHEAAIVSVATPGGKRRAVERAQPAIRSPSSITQLSYVAKATVRAPVTADPPSRIHQFGRRAVKPVAKQEEPSKPTSGMANVNFSEWNRDPDCPRLESSHPVGSRGHRKDHRAWQEAVKIWRNTPCKPTENKIKDWTYNQVKSVRKEKKMEVKEQSQVATAQWAMEDMFEREEEMAMERRGEKLVRKGQQLTNSLPNGWDVSQKGPGIGITPPPSRPASSDGDAIKAADLTKRLDAFTLRAQCTLSAVEKAKERRAQSGLLSAAKAKTATVQLAVGELEPSSKSTGSVKSERTTSGKQGDSIIDDVSVEGMADLRTKLANNRPNNTINTIGGFVLKRSTYDRVLSTVDGTGSWLDDEAVNAWFRCLVDAKNEGWTKASGKAAPYATFNTAWYKTVAEKGAQGIKTWGRRQGIDGPKLLDCESLFLPINTGAHWTLLIINGKARTYEYLDSLSGSNDRAFKITKEYLAMHLGPEYKAQEWNGLSRSRSRQQSNMSDCGVFTCFNGLASARNVNYKRLYPSKMPQAREMMAIVLNNGGFAGL